MRWPPPDDWPNAGFSRQVFSAPHRWHVQETGAGETLLLIHGAGGSTQSFRALFSHLAHTHHVVAIDLPGQGFTQLGARHRCGLEAMAEDIGHLCAQQGWQPVALVGHSAGGAIALKLAQSLLSPRGQPPAVIGINPALDTFDGIAGVLFPAIAKMLAAIPFSARIFSAASSTPSRIQALISGTGSKLESDGLALYRMLVADRDHVDATLLMMAQWSLDHLTEELPSLSARTLFITGDQDGAVPPKVSHAAAGRMQNATVVDMAGYGHLVHEEAPGEVARNILHFLDS
ncbi:alpha/beta fold hydrolase [Roseobacter sp. YSTF-M11]|uniref:Alpha/beta fold hydrolase n=1 Tax=Roseobacter insulae TaxID=2859783 RepID=A0A9X1FVU6_9RHOB|nr:alpha/beta fold hydrolase BchO [Roseobacter insulae]MBW4708304.1 alpha/beta fold hydrolase [Roseobacter insulae]